MLYFLQAYSTWLAPSSTSSRQASPWEAAEKTSVLKEVFQTLSQAPEKSALQPSKIESNAQLRQDFAFLEIQTPEQRLPPFSPLSWQPSEQLLQPIAIPSRLFPPPAELHPLAFEAPSTGSAEPASPTPPSRPATRQPERLALSSIAPPSALKESSPLVTYQDTGLIQTPLLTESQPRKKALLAAPAPALPSFPSLDELETRSYSASFDLDLVFSPKEEGEGYLFAATLIPRQDLDLSPLKQNYTFLIDRANSIQRERLLATKNAVMRALEELESGDTFNLVVFDSKMEKAFASHREFSRAALEAARAFLDPIQLGSFFTPADLYNPLFLTLPHPMNEDEVYTSILITDGENFSKKNSIRSILHTWTLQNNGKTSLYTLGIGSDAHLAALDAASALNKGRLYFAPSKRGLKRKLLKLMKTIHTPVAKNLSARAISSDSSVHIEILPKSRHMPLLYLDQPMVILGSTDTLEDFILFVQGRGKHCWFNVKKTISFLNAKKDSSLRKEWALQQAYRHYESYAQDNNPDHLAKAKQLLIPHDIQPAFE